MRFVLSALIAISAFSACAIPSFLDPKDTPRAEIASAILRTPNPVLREGTFRDSSDFVRIVTVDGKEPTTLDNIVVLPPGEHTIQVGIELRRPNKTDAKLVDITRSDTSLRFKASPDAEYLVDVALTDTGLYVWIVEEFEGDIVAGRHPSGAEKLDTRSIAPDSKYEE